MKSFYTKTFLGVWALCAASTAHADQYTLDFVGQIPSSGFEITGDINLDAIYSQARGYSQIDAATGKVFGFVPDGLDSSGQVVTRAFDTTIIGVAEVNGVPAMLSFPDNNHDGPGFLSASFLGADNAKYDVSGFVLNGFLSHMPYIYGGGDITDSTGVSFGYPLQGTLTRNAAVSVVPLPPMLPMFGAAIVILAGYGVVSKRNQSRQVRPTPA